jgi:hypothetical protein
LTESSSSSEAAPGISVTAQNHSTAIGSVENIENLHLNVQMNVQAVADGPASAAAVAAQSAVATADAVLLGPLASTEAQGLLDQAKELAADDPGAALALYRDVQSRLINAGFPGHASEFDDRVAALCVATGDEDTAIRLLMDALWAADRAGSTLQVDRVVGMLRDLAGFGPLGPTGSQEPRTAALGAAFTIADFVSDHVHAPVPGPIEMPSAAIALANDSDRARTILFAAEHALGNDDLAWIIAHRDQVEVTASAIASRHLDISVRLRLALAEATGDWDGMLEVARSAMPRDLRALTLARHARYLLLDAAPAEADREWRDAIGEACLAECNMDAADWLYSQRFIANRYGGPVVDEWHPLAVALSARPSKPKIVPSAGNVREHALAALHYDKARTASINLRRQLLDGIRSASFVDEREARLLLGECYRDSGELPLAAVYSIGAGDYEGAREVAKAFGDNYHDVTELMKSPLSWVTACALQFATEQADLIPDEDLDAVIELAFSAINDVKTGARLDSPVLSPKMSLSGYGLLAALAERLSPCQARNLLEMLSDAVVVEEHHYRYTDESHVEIAAGIASAHSGHLRTTAVEQLVGLFARRAHPFRTSAWEVLVSNLEQVRGRLTEIAAGGNREAAALLSYADPDNVSPGAAQTAAQRLRTPTTNGPNGFGAGVGDVSDSLLAATLPAQDRIECVKMLISNARSPWEPAANRDSYLIAASNLVHDFDDEHRRDFLRQAMDFATNPPRSEADAFNASFSSPLSSMRINDKSDCRPAAAFLAAKLAQTAEEKQLVRDTALRLIGVGTDDDYRVTKTLQVVRSEIGGSIGMLAQGSWTLRSLAAIMWAESTDMPDEFGAALCNDPDVRVRRALAQALVNTSHRENSAVRELLLRDPRWSVRSIFRQAIASTS